MEQENRDIYYCKLPYIKMLQMKWAGAAPNRKKSMRILLLTCLVGLALILTVQFRTMQVGSNANKYEIHFAIWGAAILIALAGYHRNKVCNPPFQKMANVRVEMADEGIYYIFQRSLTVTEVFFADDTIEEMIFDEEFKVLYIRGEGKVRNMTKDGPVEKPDVSEFYMLLPYDKYDIDDMLEPYGERAVRVSGQLRKRYSCAR